MSNQMSKAKKHPNYDIYQSDCVTGARKHLKENSVDLIITDPPYGIAADTFDKHYNRDESTVVDGYVEVPEEDYAGFSLNWIREAHRALRPNGTMYIVSGWSRLRDIYAALSTLDSRSMEEKGHAAFEETNHVIWKYNFGVFARRKFVSSHYHILALKKVPSRGQAKGNPHTFNYIPEERKGLLQTLTSTIAKERKAKDLPLSKGAYRDMEDVWYIRKEYKPGEVKNKNELPRALVQKMLQYSSNEGDVVADFFLGGFSTAIEAKAAGRIPVGFEANPLAFNAFSGEV